MSLSLQERTRRRLMRQSQNQSNTPSPAPSSSPGPSPTTPLTPLTGLGLLPIGPNTSNLSTPNPFTNGTSVNATAQHSSIATRRAFAERILKKLKLDGESRAEFMQYIETTNQEERDALQVAFTLRLGDKI
ncbi:hypothetical protein R3P38DRAFT_731362 [Favolaschia claudopus]|uniref:Uncharacterized protein n=1 Tax=Favolaschia claudopus TaxID=2862362 RepID=A0AAW0C4J4_9AGAR